MDFLTTRHVGNEKKFGLSSMKGKILQSEGILPAPSSCGHPFPETGGGKAPPKEGLELHSEWLSWGPDSRAHQVPSSLHPSPFSLYQDVALGVERARIWGVPLRNMLVKTCRLNSPCPGPPQVSVP